MSIYCNMSLSHSRKLFHTRRLKALCFVLLLHRDAGCDWDPFEGSSDMLECTVDLK